MSNSRKKKNDQQQQHEEVQDASNETPCNATIALLMNVKRLDLFDKCNCGFNVQYHAPGENISSMPTPSSHSHSSLDQQLNVLNKLSIPKFNPSNNNPYDYLSKVEVILKTRTTLPSSAYARALPALMHHTEDAVWVNDAICEGGNDKSCLDWTSAKQIFVNRFLPNNFTYSLSFFESCRQFEDEPLQEFIHRFKTVCMPLGFTITTNTHLILLLLN